MVISGSGIEKFWRKLPEPPPPERVDPSFLQEGARLLGVDKLGWDLSRPAKFMEEMTTLELRMTGLGFLAAAQLKRLSAHGIRAAAAFLTSVEADRLAEDELVLMVANDCIKALFEERVFFVEQMNELRIAVKASP